MMIHPKAGVVLFSFFNYTAKELFGVKASAATGKEKKADIKTSDDKSFIQLRFDEIFHTQIAPVRSVLICTHLNEAEFDALDESFHALIPKTLALFSDSSDERYIQTLLRESGSEPYDTSKIKEALFGEFVLPDKKSLMSEEQQKIVHLSFEEEIEIKGLPGSGKSSVLVAKALYEKMMDPKLKLIILGRLSCSVHNLQALIFQFTENSHWSLNPAEITVSSFESLQRRAREKEKYDLIVCDDINEDDLGTIRALLSKKGRLIVSSSYEVDELVPYPLTQNFRLSPALCAACEGVEVESLQQNLSLQSGNTFMNTIVILEKLLQEVPAKEISILHHNKEELLTLQSEINSFFTPISYLFDEAHEEESLLLYPLSHLSCLINSYVIIILDDPRHTDRIELLSRANIKSFILSESEAVHHLIKGENNETY